VVSGDYAPHVQRLARECPVWLIHSPETEALARRVRDTEPEADLTLFSADSDAEASLLAILSEVELHHGVRSHDAPVSLIEVLGTPVTDAIREELRALGFPRLEASPEGFVALRAQS
jgi:hypothetical protein